MAVGTAEGLGLIDAETRGHRWLNFRVVAQRPTLLQAPRVVEIRRENSAGALTVGGSLRTDAENHARWVIRYRDDGSAEKIELYDPSNRLVQEALLRRQASTNKLIVTFERNNAPITQSAVQALVVDPLASNQRLG